MSSSPPVPPLPAGEPDLLPRSTKKPKHNGVDVSETSGVDVDAVVPEEMEVLEVDGTDPVYPPSDPPTWTSKLFPDAHSNRSDRLQFYLGEDEEERYAGVDELFCSGDSFEEQPPPPHLAPGGHL